MKRRNLIRIISFFSACIIVVGGFYIRERNINNNYKLQIQNDYSKSLNELDSALNNIHIMLEKLVYVAGSPKLSMLSAELYSEAELAKNALSQLPTSAGTYDTVNRFLSQVGNYALSVSKSYITGNEITKEQKTSLQTLSDTASTVSQTISDSQINYNNPEYWSKEIEQKLDSTVDEDSLADMLTKLEENLTDYPTLIYDGPFSDHILSKKPLMTTGKSKVSETDALATAKKLSGINTVKYSRRQSGKIECYVFSDNNTDVSVSINGGQPLYMRKSRSVGKNVLSYEQALDKAKRFMRDMGFENMIPTYHYSDEGVCVINYAYLDGQTICYTDLMKVGVSLDNGEIMLYEASGYLTNHTERAFETPVHTVAEATASINSMLKIESVSIALIPTSGGGEMRCYEFLCKGENEEKILVYVNIQSLQVEDIYILLQTDGGTLVK